MWHLAFRLHEHVSAFGNDFPTLGIASSKKEKHNFKLHHNNSESANKTETLLNKLSHLDSDRQCHLLIFRPRPVRSLKPDFNWYK